MDAELIGTFGKIAGIGGVAIGALLLIYRDVIRKEIFPGLTRDQAYKIIRLLILLTFIVALTGILAWVWVQVDPLSKSSSAHSPYYYGNYKRIYYQGFNFLEDDEEALAQALEAGWLIGKRGDWEGDIFQGKYRLCNVSGNENSSYTARMSHIVPSGKTSLQDAMVTVRVRVLPPNGTYSGAGILFRKRPDEMGYLAYMLQAGTTASLLRKREGSLAVLASMEVPLPSNSNMHMLRLVALGENLELYSDGEKIYPSEKSQQVDLLEGDPGVFAYSLGCFLFDDFAIYQRLE